MKHSSHAGTSSNGDENIKIRHDTHVTTGSIASSSSSSRLLEPLSSLRSKKKKNKRPSTNQKSVTATSTTNIATTASTTTTVTCWYDPIVHWFPVSRTTGTAVSTVTVILLLAVSLSILLPFVLKSNRTTTTATATTNPFVVVQNRKQNNTDTDTNACTAVVGNDVHCSINSGAVATMIQSFCSFNNYNNDNIPHQALPSHFATRITCHPSMGVDISSHNTTSSSNNNHHHHRTIVAQNTAISGHRTLLLQISKSLTIWDIDAIQDPWMRHVIPQQQQQPHNEHQNQTATSSSTIRLSAAVYLSVYLARLMFHEDHHRHTGDRDTNDNSWDTSSSNASDTSNLRNSRWQLSQLRQRYIATLPRRVGEFNDHPIFWSDDDNDEDDDMGVNDTVKSGRNNEQLQRIFGGTYSITYQSIRQLQQMIRTEYNTLVQNHQRHQQEHMSTSTTSSWTEMISYRQYRMARVNVLSRSFGTGPIPQSSDLELNQRVLDMRRSLCVPHLQFTNGHHVMVPILDQLNHNGQDSNVDFHYDIAQQSFIVQSKTMIPIGHEIMDHYGKHTSSHLFAKYGFVNYDTTSDYNEATIALWHTLLPLSEEMNDNDYSIESQLLTSSLSEQIEERKYRMQMLRYLQYDDGYASCVGDSDSNNLPIHSDGYSDSTDNAQEASVATAWTLKQLKYQFLLTIIGKQSSRWIVQMSPLQVVVNQDEPTQQQVRGHIKSDNLQQLLSTCRLLVLRHDDYNGTAYDILQRNRNNRTFYLPSPFQNTLSSSTHSWKNNSFRYDRHDHDSQNRGALEFRAYMCLARMVHTAMIRFPRSSVSKQLDYIEELKRSAIMSPKVDVSFRRNWTIAHLHFSELQTLETLKQIVFSHLRQHYSNRMDVPNSNKDSIASNVLYTMRDQPCQFQQYLQPLLHRNYSDI